MTSTAERGPSAPPQAGGRRAGGRPLDLSRDDDLRRATLELLAEVGYDRLTIGAVAALAGAGKGTVYRRWAGKAELVVDAVRSLHGSPAPPDTHSLRGDLEAISRGTNPMTQAFESKVMRGLLSALLNDADLHRAFHEMFVLPLSEVLAGVFRRAVERGEIPPERNIDLLGEVMPALIIRRWLLESEQPGVHYAEAVIRDVILPLATAPAGTEAREAGRTSPT